jgi:cell division protein FtsB
VAARPADGGLKNLPENFSLREESRIRHRILLLLRLRKAVCFVSRKKTIKPRFWLLMMAVLVMVFGGVYLSQGQYLSTQAQHIAALEAEKAQALDQNAALERKIAFAKTSEYVERVARDQLGLLKKNEVRFVTGGN